MTTKAPLDVCMLFTEEVESVVDGMRCESEVIYDALGGLPVYGVYSMDEAIKLLVEGIRHWETDGAVAKYGEVVGLDKAVIQRRIEVGVLYKAIYILNQFAKMGYTEVGM